MRHVTISKKTLLWGLAFLGFLLLMLYNGTNGTFVAKNKEVDTQEILFAHETKATETRDSLALAKRSLASERRKNIVAYLNQMNAAVALTPEALDFALMELALGINEPLEDALLRLEEGRQRLSTLMPPPEAMALHEMSLRLLEEYRKVLEIPLTIPREEFDSRELNDDFERLAVLVALTRKELQNINAAYGSSFSSRVVKLYDEAIGL